MLVTDLKVMIMIIVPNIRYVPDVRELELDPLTPMIPGRGVINPLSRLQDPTFGSQLVLGRGHYSGL